MVHHQTLDTTLSAIADPTRRLLLRRIAERPATISELAQHFGMSLTGMKKHVAILERAGLLATEKQGRVRTCTLGPHRLDDVTGWIAAYHQMLNERLDSLETFLEQTKDKP